MTWRDLARRLGVALIITGGVLLIFVWLIVSYPHPFG
jgi:hypothetical protein